jgi:hypothetical protein
MAEVHSLRADLLARRPDSEAASREARDAAALLEGARTTAYEASLGGAPSKGDARGESRELFGLLPSDEIEWDGRPSGATLTAASGEHQVRVLRRGALVWAGWVELAPGQSRVTLTVPVPEPCTALDLGNVGSKRGRAVPPSDVRCPNWALARPAERSSVEIATCQGSECGPWLRWRHDAGVPSVPPDHRHATEPWPVWATYVAAGVGAVLATGLVLWQTGAFDEPEPGSTVWVFGGVAPARR